VSDSLTYAGSNDSEPKRTSDEARPSGPSLSLPPGSRLVAFLLGGVGLVGLLAVAALGAGIAMWWELHPTAAPPPVEVAATPPSPEPAPAAPLPVPMPVPVPVPETPVAPAPGPVVAAPRPRPAPAVVPEPAPVVVAPLPEPVPEPVPEPAPARDPRYVRVTLQGDVSRVYLQSASGNTPLPADVLPGTYQVQAFFESDPVSVGEVTLVAGTDRTLFCRKDLRKCK
jgi:hypothetical protein